MSVGGGGGEVEQTQQEKELAFTAASDFNYYKENFVPLENSFIAQLSATDGEANMQRGIGASDVEQAFKGSDAKVVAGSKGQQGQGKSVMARAGLSDSKGTARGEAVAGADAAMRNRELSGLTKMAAYGRNLADTNSVTMRDAANTATSNAINKAQNDQAESGQLGTFLGSAVGTYTGFKSSYDELTGGFSLMDAGKKKGP